MTASNCIFLTGGSGFIGRHVITQALKRGIMIIAQKLPEIDPAFPETQGLIWVSGYYHDDWSQYLKKCDLMIHLAAHSANPPYDSLQECVKQNVLDPLALFNQAVDCGITRYIVAGTSFEYGISGSVYEFIPVHAPLLPTNSYSISKAASSVVFAGWSIMNHVMLKYIRFFQVFGEGEPDFRLWPSMRKAALNGYDFDLTEGEQIRDFINVESVAEKILQQTNFEDFQQDSPKFFNLGSGNPMTIRKFAEFWWKQWGATGKLNFGALPYRDNEVMRFVPLIED